MFWLLVSQQEILIADLKRCLSDAAGDSHKSWSRSVVSMSCLSFVIFLLWCQGHVTAYVGFPTMPGMNDEMFMYYHVSPHG